MISKKPLLAAVSFAALLASTPLRASIAVSASFDEKVDKAAGIVLGRCMKSESRYDPTGRWIVTYSTFAVEQSMKGAAGPTVTVVMPGGSVNGIHQASVGIPAFNEGSENVLFLRNTRLGPTVLYFDQGAYDVHTDERGRKVVAPVASDMVHIDEQRGLAVPAEAPRTLQEFRSDVDQSMRTAADRRQKMAIVAAQKRNAQATPTLYSMIVQNKLLIAAALLGLALAAWQLRRSGV